MSLFRREVGLEERIVLDRLLDDAFSPSRTRTAPISAARVRARVAWHRPADRTPLRGLALLGRLAESSLAIGMTAILFAGSLAGVDERDTAVQADRGDPGRVSALSAATDDSAFVRLLSLGRATPVTGDVRRGTAPRQASDDDDSVIIVRERQGRFRPVTPPVPEEHGIHERQGLVR